MLSNEQGQGDGGKEKAEEGGFKYLTKVRISDQKHLRNLEVTWAIYVSYAETTNLLLPPW